MENKPVDIQHYIKLITDEELSKEWYKKWYHIVKKYAPSGVLSSVEETDPQGNPSSVKMIRTKMKNGTNHYVIPLTRHLREYEAKRIIEEWQLEYGKSDDWDVYISSDQLEIPDYDHDEDLKGKEFEDLCYQIAKHQHNRWCEDRVNEGWRYGMEFSEKDKTHPMIVPWEKLPEKWQKGNKDVPKKVIEYLYKNGYKIVPRKD